MSKNRLVIIIILISLISCNKRDNTSLSNRQPLDYKILKKQKNINIDSLYQTIVNTKDDTLKVYNLISIFRLSIRNRPLRNDILEEALTISKKINYQTGIAKSLNIKGVNARYQHHYLKSIKLHKEAIPYFTNSWDIESKIKNVNALGVSYRRLNLEEEAIIQHMEALKLAEKFNFTRSVAMALNGIGNSYVALKKYDDAIKYFNLSLKWNKLEKNERGKGYDYSNLGEAFMYKKQYDSAFYYQNMALEIANKSNRLIDQAIIKSSMGLMFQNKEDWSQALEYYFESISVLKKSKRKRLLSFTLINSGIIFTQLNEFEIAKEYLNTGLKLSSEILSKDNLVLGYQALSDILEQEGKSDDALKNYKLMVVYRDSIFNIQSDNNTVAMNIKYDSDKKDEKIKRLNLENEVSKSRDIILFLTIGLLIVLSVFLFIFNRMKIKNNNMLIENMRGQIESYLSQISKLEHEDNENNTLDLSEKLNAYRLSSRELEVLNYITKGMKNQEIADVMYVTLSTIKTHTKNIYNKLDVRNRIEAAKKAQSI